MLVPNNNLLLESSTASDSFGIPFLLTAATTSVLNPIGYAVELGTFPAVGMLVATLLGLRFPTPSTVVGALQHFSAGILLTTVAKELLPEMVQAEGLAENLASGVGFFSGVGLLILLGMLLPEGGEATLKTTTSATTEAIKTTPSLRNRRQSLRKEAFAIGHVGKGSSSVLATKTISAEDDALLEEEADLFSDTDTDSRRSKGAASEASTAFLLSTLPLAFLIAIAIDAALDGLLIGVSLAADPSTGPLFSASLTVESTFLGLTIATALRGGPSSLSFLSFLASGMGPASLLTGSLLGGALAPTLVDSPVLLAGLLGFGTSTILFMVAEELLLQAHEDGQEHIWWVDLQLYTGFFASVMVEKWVGM